MQEDSISGYFDRDTQRDLSAKWPLAVLARKQLVGRNVIQLWMVLTLCRLLPTHDWWFHRFGPQRICNKGAASTIPLRIRVDAQGGAWP